MSMKNTNELHHHGIKGMRWGVRRNLQEKRRAKARQKKSLKSRIRVLKEKASAGVSKAKKKTKATNQKIKGAIKKKQQSPRSQLDKNIKRSVRLNEENKFMNFGNNRMLSNASRRECKKIFKNRENYSYNDLKKLSQRFEEESAVSNALYQRTKQKSEYGRMVARAAVNVAFDGDLKYASEPMKRIIDSTDRTKSADAVKRDMLRAGLQSMANYSRDQGIDFSKLVGSIGGKNGNKK